MKKLLLLAFTAIIMAGCEERPINPSTDYSNDAMTVFIDSCEYFKCEVRGHSYGNIYSHKGNCRYCTERRKQELKELVEQLK